LIDTVVVAPLTPKMGLLSVSGSIVKVDVFRLIPDNAPAMLVPFVFVSINASFANVIFIWKTSFALNMGF